MCGGRPGNHSDGKPQVDLPKTFNSIQFNAHPSSYPRRNETCRQPMKICTKLHPKFPLTSPPHVLFGFLKKKKDQTHGSPRIHGILATCHRYADGRTKAEKQAGCGSQSRAHLPNDSTSTGCSPAQPSPPYTIPAITHQPSRAN